MKQSRAFSLIELIIAMVVLVIVFLAVFGSVETSRQRANQALCSQNLHGLNVALNNYVSDYDGHYPPSVVSAFVDHEATAKCWSDLITPYESRTTYYCPSRELPGALAHFSSRPEVAGYAYNDRLAYLVAFGHSETSIGRPESVIGFPSVTVTLLEARAGISARRSPDLGREFLGIFSVDFRADILAQREGAIRHSGGSNYAFADGHVSWHRPGQIRKGRISDGAHPGFGL